MKNLERQVERHDEEIVNYLMMKGKYNEVVKKYMYLVPVIANKYRPVGIDNEDLIGIGFIGLIEGVKKYNGEFTIKAFLIKSIEKEIVNFIIKNQAYSSRMPIDNNDNDKKHYSPYLYNDDLDNLSKFIIENSINDKEAQQLMLMIPLFDRLSMLIEYGFITEETIGCPLLKEENENDRVLTKRIDQ